MRGIDLVSSSSHYADKSPHFERARARATGGIEWPTSGMEFEHERLDVCHLARFLTLESAALLDVYLRLKLIFEQRHGSGKQMLWRSFRCP